MFSFKQEIERQVAALGQSATALVNAIDALSRSNVPFMPSTLVMGGNGNGTLEGVAALFMRQLAAKEKSEKDAPGV